MVAFNLEGRGYTISGFNKPKPGFKLNGGRGMVEILLGGSYDVHFNRFNEDISITKPKILVKNIIFGG